MKIDVSPLLRAEQTKLDFSFELDAPDDFAGAHFENKIKISGEVINQTGYMTLSATALLDYTTNCARCMKDISGTFELRLENRLRLKEVFRMKMMTNTYLLKEEVSTLIFCLKKR